VAKKSAQLQRGGEIYVWNYWCRSFAHVVARLFRFPRYRGIYPHSSGPGYHFDPLSLRGGPLSTRLSAARKKFRSANQQKSRAISPAFFFWHQRGAELIYISITQRLLTPFMGQE
jgi:hypothetical protein